MIYFVSAYSAVAECQVTPAIWDINPPNKFHHTNNLVAQGHSTKKAQGKIIMLQGRLLDVNCLPISNAVIYLWQGNFLGVKQYNNTDYHKHDRNFQSTGTAITDNLGHFSFITIMPGVDGQTAPHVNMRIKHHFFSLFESKFFFENQAINEYAEELLMQPNDASYNALIMKLEPNQWLQSEEEAMPIYNFSIVLNERDKYRR